MDFHPVSHAEPQRDGARRRHGSRRPGLECLERRELLSLSGWAIGLGSPADREWGWETAADADGNVYVTGRFEGTVDFDPDPAGQSNLTSQGGGDAFVAKYSPTGALIWATSAGSAADDDEGRKIAVDSSGNATVTLLTAGLSDDRFWHLDANGNTLWSQAIVTTDRFDANDVAVDADGDIYLAGLFTETADFGDTAVGQTISLTSAGGGDILVAKYAPTGEVIWAQRAGSPATQQSIGYDWANGITVDDDGNVYLAGQARVGADFGDHTAGLPQAKKGKPKPTSLNIFVAKMDADGTFQWVSMASGTSIDIAEDVSVDGNGNVYITGDFGSESAAFGSHTINKAGDYDVFAAKLDPSGNSLWARAMGGLGRDSGFSISADDVGNVYVAGDFAAAGDYGPFQLAPKGTVSGAGFLAKLDAAGGNVLSAQEIGWGITASVGSDGTLNYTGAIKTDASGEEFPTGETLISTPQADGSPSGDIFVSKMDPEVPGIRSLAVSPQPVVQGDTLTLSAHGVLDVGGRVASVAFYRDADGNGAFDAGIDELLGTDTDVSDAWGVAVSTTDFPLGPQTYFAVATDNDGLTSDAAAAIGEVVEDGAQPDVYESTDTPLAITDAHPKKGPKTTTSELVIASANDVGLLDLVISLDDGSSDVSDLTATLTSPDNTPMTVPLASGTTTYADFGFVGESLGGTWTLAITDSVRGNTHTLNSWSLTVVPVPAGGASSSALMAAASFEQQNSFEPIALLSVSRLVTAANGHDDGSGDAADELFASDGPAVDYADLLVDDRLFPASPKRHAKRSALDLVLEDITADPFNEQLAEDLALALV